MCKRPVLFSIGVCLLLQLNTLPASDAAIRVILVGVSEHNDRQIPPLPNAGADMKDLVDALQHAGIHQNAQHVIMVQLFGTPLAGGTPPTRQNILQALSQQAESASADDILLFYFTGHAVTDAAGRACLLPCDATITSGQNLESVISVNDLRTQLESSPAGHKVVVIDSCYSGGFARQNPVVPIARAFSDANIYTITSSSDDELSVIWPSRRQSLATRWLCHGLRGGADRDLDGTVSMDELFGFLEQNVATSFPVVQSEIEARSDDGEILHQLNQRTQTPQRMIGPPWTNPRLFVMQPHSATEAIRSLAMQLVDRIRIAAELKQLGQSARVCVLPAVSLIGTQVQRGQYPVLEQLTAPYITNELLRFGQGQFETLDVVAVSQALTKNFRVQAIDHQRRSQFEGLLEACGGEVDFFIHTRLFLRDNHLVFEAELLSAHGGRVAYKTSVVVALSPELRDSVKQQSSQVPPRVHQQNRPETQEPATQPSQTPAIQPAQQPSQTPAVPQATQPDKPQIARPVQHPHHQDYKDWPVHVSVQLKYQSGTEPWTAARMQSTSDQSDAVFSVRNGQNLKLIVRNKTDRPLAAVVYVDGVNILGKKCQTPAEALQDSGYWILEPNSTGAFDGWYVRDDAPSSADQPMQHGNFSGHHFLVADAPSSVASQLSYSACLGDVRIHLFETSRVSPYGKTVGFAPGRQVARSLKLHPLAADQHQPVATLIYKYVDGTSSEN